MASSEHHKSPTTPDTFTSGNLYDEIVRIKVGTGEASKVFEIHEGVLCFYSGYFRAALKGEFSEAHSKSIELETEEVEVFRLFMNWLYTRKFHAGQEPDVDHLSQSTILKLWTFADRRQIPLLMNTAINLLKAVILMKWAVPTKYLPYVYSNTTSQSKIRHFVVDCHAHLMNESDREWLDGKHFVEDALRDLAKALLSRPAFMTKSEFDKWDMCKYHVHEEGVRCPNR